MKDPTRQHNTIYCWKAKDFKQGRLKSQSINIFKAFKRNEGKEFIYIAGKNNSPHWNNHWIKFYGLFYAWGQSKRLS